MKFDIDICVGFFQRKKVREHLNHSVLTLQYNFPDSTITLKEEKALLNSKFYIKGVNLPDRETVVKFISNVWIKKIKSLDTDYEENGED